MTKKLGIILGVAVLAIGVVVALSDEWKLLSG